MKINEKEAGDDPLKIQLLQPKRLRDFPLP